MPSKEEVEKLITEVKKILKKHGVDYTEISAATMGGGISGVVTDKKSTQAENGTFSERKDQWSEVMDMIHTIFDATELVTLEKVGILECVKAQIVHETTHQD